MAIIATCPRYYGSGNTQYRLKHYLDLLERKPRSVFNVKPARDNVTKALLDWGSQLPSGNKEMSKLLRLCVYHGEERILAIKRLIPSHIVPTVNMVRTYRITYNYVSYHAKPTPSRFCGMKETII